jgi:type III pantothenate kinase
MNLSIDIGNSLIKYGLFEKNNMALNGIFQKDGFSILKDMISANKVKHIIYAAVADVPVELKEILENFKSVVALQTNTPIPLQNKYLTPETLGTDRLANACGAVALFPGKDVLVVDSGTCLKFDIVSADGCYLGGAISPGMQMRFRALNQQTALLPLITPCKEPLLVGRNTEESIRSGVMNGMMAELNDITLQYSKMFPRLEIVLTGGDANFFLNQFKSRIFAAPHLTLIGLNHIVSNLHHEQK